MKVVVLILLLNYASAEAEAKAEADPKHRSGHSGQVKKPVVKIANPKLIHTSHVIENQKGAFQVWLVKGQAKNTEQKHLKRIVNTPARSATKTQARIKQRNFVEGEQSSIGVSNSLDSLSAPSQELSHHHPAPHPGFSQQPFCLFLIQ